MNGRISTYRGRDLTERHPLQEFVDARRQPSIQNAPQVLYSNREPPLEIRSVPGLSRGEDVGYVTFVLFPRHFRNPDAMASTISRIQLFRDYLHYHSGFQKGSGLANKCRRTRPQSHWNYFWREAYPFSRPLLPRPQ